MRAIAVATGGAVALVGVYLALGGASYAPAAVADPCAPREGLSMKGFEHVAEQIVLSALDGAACELDVSREEVVLAFSSRASLERFAQEHEGSERELERLVRAGLRRALDDAGRANLLDPRLAELLRSLIERVPIEQLLDLLERLPRP
jgi:hypothetical protein